MSMTIGAYSGLPDPVEGGYSIKGLVVGEKWQFLDGSKGAHRLGEGLGGDYAWDCSGANHTNLILALRAAYYVAKTVIDHLGNTETMMVTAWSKGVLIDDATFRVTATLEETTA